jgi:hypothetical protein
MLLLTSESCCGGTQKPKDPSEIDMKLDTLPWRKTLKNETITGDHKKASRSELIELLNQDLSREYCVFQ